MLQKLLFCAILLSLCSCGTYRYYNPVPNPALFKGEGEVQVSGNIGSSGVSARGAVSLPNNIALMGTYNHAPFEYRSKEGEIGIGYYTHENSEGILLAGGIGFGSNSKYTDSTYTAKLYSGDFIRPFIQFNGGITGGTIIGELKGDIVGVFKANYLMYNGRHLDGTGDPIKSRFVLLEPGVNMGLGLNFFTLDLSLSFPIHPVLRHVNRREHARVFPLTVGLGMRFIIGRGKNNRSTHQPDQQD